MPDIYLYETISEFSAEKINRSLTNNEGNDVTIRMTTRGGYTPAGAAMIMGIDKFPGKVKMSVDGDVSSMGAIMLLYADEVEMSEMAEVMFHKAAYPDWYMPSDDEKANLKRENDRFKKKMEKRLGEAGQATIDKIFEEGKRNDVYLTARQAKKIGLVNKVITLDPSQKAAVKMAMENMPKEGVDNKKSNTNINKNANNMLEITQDQLDAKLAKAEKAGYDKGLEAGRKKEADRRSAWEQFADVDPDAVKTGLESGEEMSRSEEIRMMRLANQKDAKKELENDNADGVETEGQDSPVDEKTAEQKRKEAVRAEVEKACGITSKTKE